MVFALALFLNWIWEVVHSRLYLNYQGGAISSFILFRAAVFDALMVLGLIFVSWKIRKGKLLFVFFGGLALAIGIEIWALYTGRWEYEQFMPLVPILGIGLTPMVQLAITGLLVKKICR
jgi:cadmium resistance protein CadD (predicted permease)